MKIALQVVFFKYLLALAQIVVFNSFYFSYVKNQFM